MQEQRKFKVKVIHVRNWFSTLCEMSGKNYQNEKHAVDKSINKIME